MNKKYKTLSYKIITDMMKEDYILRDFVSTTHKTTKIDDYINMRITFLYDDKSLTIETSNNVYFVFGRCYGFITETAMERFTRIIRQLEEMKRV